VSDLEDITVSSFPLIIRILNPKSHSRHGQSLVAWRLMQADMIQPKLSSTQSRQGEVLVVKNLLEWGI
jgi:hypothetical protein